MKNNQKTIDKFRLLIQSELKNLDKDIYPKVYERANSIGGYQQIEQHIVTVCVKNGWTPKVAISHLETEF